MLFCSAADLLLLIDIPPESYQFFRNHIDGILRDDTYPQVKISKLAVHQVKAASLIHDTFPNKCGRMTYTVPFVQEKMHPVFLLFIVVFKQFFHRQTLIRKIISIIVDQSDFRKTGASLRMLLHKSHLLFQFIRKPLVITVLKRHIISSTLLKSMISSITVKTIFIHLYILYPRISIVRH